MDTIEIINFNFVYNKENLINEWQTSTPIPIGDINIKYIDELELKVNKKIMSKKIKDIRKEFANNQQRSDFVVECTNYSANISYIIDLIKKRIPGSKIGTIAYFFQKKDQDVPIHVDFPYRKNSLLLIPLFGKATTFYKDSNSYVIDQPVIMNVNKPHGVRDVTEDRLSLHIEIPNLTIEEIKERMINE